jgi:hypothetical protein
LHVIEASPSLGQKIFLKQIEVVLDGGATSIADGISSFVDRSSANYQMKNTDSGSKNLGFI